MARPTKNGFDWFPMDTAFFMDDMIVELRMQCGCEGVITYLACCCIAFSNGTYYLDNTPVTFEKLKSFTGLSRKKSQKYLEKMVEINLFSLDFFKEFSKFSSAVFVKTLERMQEKRKEKCVISNFFYKTENGENDQNSVNHRRKQDLSSGLFPKKPRVNVSVRVPETQQKQRVFGPYSIVQYSNSIVGYSPLPPPVVSSDPKTDTEDGACLPSSDSLNDNLITDTDSQRQGPVDVRPEGSSEVANAAQANNELEKPRTLFSETHYDDIELQGEDETMPYEPILASYKAICGDKLKVPREVRPTHRTAIKARKKDLKKIGMSWEEYFRKVRSSPFLTGDNDSGWTASFDWILKSENFEKIIEGQYDNRKRKKWDKPGMNESYFSDPEVYANAPEEWISQR